MPETIGTAYVQIEPSAKGLSGSISSVLDPEADSAGKSAGGKLSNALGSAAKIGMTAIAGASAAVAGFGKTAIDAGQQFDSSMSQVAATMGFSTAELNDNTSQAAKTFEQLSSFAQEMGSTTAFSASQAADALNYMALAGYDADTSMKMLPNVLNLAAAGGIDLASASDMVTDAQSALGLSLDQTSVMVDQMAAASSKSNTSVAQLGEAFLTIGANAKSLSGGTQELSTALGLLADNGIKGAEGGTHLRNIMLALNPTTDKAKKAWKELGISAYDAQGNLRPLEDTFGDLNKAMEGMNDQEKSKMLSTMFNKTDLASVNALLSTSSQRWEELSGSIGDASGAAQNMADVQLDNLSGDITLFQSALEGVQIQVSNALTPALRDFVQLGSSGLSEIANALQSGDFEGAFAVLGDYLGQFVNKIVDMLPQLVSAAQSLISSFAQAIIDNLPQIIECGMQLILQLAMGIAQALPELIPTIVDTVLMIVDTLIDNIDMLVDAAIAIMTGLAEGLITALPRLVEKVPELIIKLIEAFVTNAPKLAEASLKLMIELGIGLIKAIPELIKNIPKIVGEIVLGFAELISEYQSIGKDIVEGLWNGIKNSWKGLVDNVKGLAGELVKSVKEKFSIGSPSKVFRDEVGQWIPAGVSVGIDSNLDTLKNSMSNMEDVISTDMDVSSNYAMDYDTSNSDMYSLMAEYLPMLSNIGNMSVSLEGDAKQLFRAVRKENNAYRKSNGASAFA